MQASENHKIFSERLKHMAKVRWMSQAGIARKMGINPANVNNWIKGKHVPSHEVLNVLASVLETSPAYLLGEIDTNSPAPEITRMMETGTAYAAKTSSKAPTSNAGMLVLHWKGLRRRVAFCPDRAGQLALLDAALQSIDLELQAGDGPQPQGLDSGSPPPNLPLA